MRGPVLLLTGSTGVGKPAVLSAASFLLSDAGVRHASVTLSDVGRLYPTPVDDHWNERIAHQNLKSLWCNYAAEGAERLLLERVVETRSRGVHGHAKRGLFLAGRTRVVNQSQRQPRPLEQFVERQNLWIS